jgi:hypothetical protein
MINQYKNQIRLVLITALLFTGCEQQQKKDISEQEEVSTQIPYHITPVIETSGGLKTWTETKKLEFDCIATFYQPDGSFYLTKQHHEIYPWSNLIRISAHEPQGKFVWEFSSGRLNTIEETKQEDFLPVGLDAEDFAKAILDITTTPVRLLESKAELTKSKSPIKIEGLWYYPIGQDELDNRPNIIFYENRDSTLIDMIWFVDAERGTPLAVRGYHYHEIEKSGVFVPAKIEIFMTDNRRIIQNRLVTIDYH